jgi:hypothetical protein
MDGRSCGFDRARSRPAKIIKGTKKAAYYPKARCSPQSLARRLASPFFLPAASSYYEALTVTQLDKDGAACSEADATRPDEGFCHAPPCLSFLRLLPPPISFCAGNASKVVGEAEPPQHSEKCPSRGRVKGFDEVYKQRPRFQSVLFPLGEPNEGGEQPADRIPVPPKAHLSAIAKLFHYDAHEPYKG